MTGVKLRPLKTRLNEFSKIRQKKLEKMASSGLEAVNEPLDEAASQ